MWSLVDHRTKYPLHKGCAVPESLCQDIILPVVVTSINYENINVWNLDANSNCGCYFYSCLQFMYISERRVVIMHDVKHQIAVIFGG